MFRCSVSLSRVPQRGGEGGARRPAHQEAFLPGQPPRGVERVAVAHPYHLVHHLAVEGAGMKSSPIPSTLKGWGLSPERMEPFRIRPRPR